jgi:aspartate racemase
LADYLPNQPVYGLQPLGLDGKQTPHQRVEDMAAHYIKEIQSIQPNGPYYLGGFSFGGLVAFEVAQQLQARGEKVALLALFDSRVSGYFQPLKTRDWLLHQVKQVLQRGPNYILDRVKAKAKPKTEQVQDKVEGAMSMYAETFNLDRHSLADQNILSVMEAGVKAEEDYVPQVYPAQVDLFRAILDPAPEGCYIDPQLGWGKIAVNRVKIHKVPSLHADMFKQPQIQILSEQLRNCLNKAQADDSV